MKLEDYKVTLKTLKQAVGDKVKSTTVKNVVTCTLAEYNAMSSHDANTEYHITDDAAASTTILQAFYDGLYPVGNVQFGLQAPQVPNNVTATWADVSTEYEGRYFKVDSAKSLGTSEAEEIPQHKHTGLAIGTYGIGWNVGGGSTTGIVGMAQKEGGAIFADDIRIKKELTDIGDVVAGTKVKPLTTTIKVWRRTA